VYACGGGQDLLIVVGARLGEMTSQGYSMLPIPGSGGAPGDAQVPRTPPGSQAILSLTARCGVERQALVHVHPSGDELNSGGRDRLQTPALAGLRR